MDSDSQYSTYSETENYIAWAAERRKISEQEQEENEESRRQFFNKLAPKMQIGDFVLPGLKIIVFNHLRIKFTFQPKYVVDFIDDSLSFCCSLKYINHRKYWTIKNKYLPADIQSDIYSNFCNDNIEDHDILKSIRFIHVTLKNWSIKQEAHHINRFEKWQNGDSDTELYSDEERMFLDETEQLELKIQRNTILARMIPPA